MEKIIIHGSQCQIFNLERLISEHLENKFSYEPLGAEYTTSYKEHRWDGIQRIFRYNKFPIGLLEMVLQELKLFNIIPEVTDNRHVGEKHEFKRDSSILRDYQKEAISKALEHKMGSFEMSTGSGKTLVFSELIANLGYKTLIIVPSIEILRQTQIMVSNYLNESVGIIGDNRVDVQWITVGTWQSLVSGSWDYSNYLNSVDLLIIDEAQHDPAPMLKQLNKQIPGVYRYGFSGTMFREQNDDMELFACTGPVIYKIGYSYLIKNNYLVPPKIRILKLPSKNYSRYSTYQDVYEDYVVANEYRNVAIVNQAKELIEEGRKVLIFVTRISHGTELQRLSNKEFVYSSHPDRRFLIDSFRDGDLKCLISTNLMDEGFDCPPVDAIILAAPQKSLIRTIQRVGRGLRPFENKKDCIIIDTMDSCRYLYKAFQRRYSFYKSEPSFTIEKPIDIKGENTLEDWL